ncbi:MAG: phosphatidylglycerol lysyltransferase domain-containing protein [Clostridium sp.]|jgi:hypothetical protein|nr:phosphatidylglycerol lysyltransferase domain-containing protein [Clostridium sp.]
MLDFREMTLGDYAPMKAMQEASRQTACEYLPGNIYLWGKHYGTQICFIGGDFYASFSPKFRSYCFPTGGGDPAAALEELRLDAERRGNPFRLFGLFKENCDLLEQLYPCCFAFAEQRDMADYVYTASELAELPGKRYHAKRNHISAFVKANSWHYEPMGRNNIAECKAFQRVWFAANQSKSPAALAQENEVVQAALENFFALGFVGGVLFVNREVVGFTLGERVNESVFCTHIEKADGSIRGAYPMLNQQFAQNALGGYSYINREEDTGDEGLRKAKLSYHPAMLPMEYSAQMR